MSGGVYLRLTGKTFVRGGAERRLGLRGRMPLPLLVAHSGKMTMTRFWFFLTKSSSSTSLVPSDGCVLGLRNARMTACSSETGSTWRVLG